MDVQSKKRFQRRFLLLLAVISLVVMAIIFWRAQPPPGAPAKPAKIVFRSRLAERGWYSADANELSRQIEGFFQKADIEPIENLIGLILPHAGYEFSGQIAAFGVKTIGRNYNRIVIIGPSHYTDMEEVLSVPRVTHYETPLGQIPLDMEFIEKLLKFPIFQYIPSAHEYEHSVQIELPLLQKRQQNFKLVPIVAGQCSRQTISKAAAILKGLIDKETLVVASSDFTHYGPRYRYVPFKENVPEQLNKLDMAAYEQIERLDSSGFLEYKRKTGITICGYIPIAILLSMLDKPAKTRLIKYATSGEISGDFTNSVSYFAIAICGQWQNCPEIKPQANTLELTPQDKKQLLALARKTIVYALRERRVPQVSELDIAVSEAMARPRAAFVTLKKNHQLRGCIGDVFPQRPLYRSVIRNAINASLNDKRFLPLTEVECNDITIEVSVLTVPEPIDSFAQIRIGIDGVVLSKDGHSALFLPQVATEQGWDLNQMLTQLSLKAGLPPDAWKEGARFLVFQAEVFSETGK